jgi:alcohol dehydrogenase (cytochrome c)
LLALDPKTGDTLWHLNVGEHVQASLMTYELGGRQYIIVPVGDTMYAFSLPEKIEAKK